jgi:hypothetical protein
VARGSFLSDPQSFEKGKNMEVLALENDKKSSGPPKDLSCAPLI